jgi:hypothetical protein
MTIFPERNLLHLPVRFSHPDVKPFVDGSLRTGVIGKLQVTSHALITALVHAHPNRRYSNTLFVTLNNRIYFRDHPSPEGPGDSAHVTPLAFGNRRERGPGFAAQPRPSQSTTSSGTSIRLHTLLPPTDTEKGKSDFVTTRPVTP